MRKRADRSVWLAVMHAMLGVGAIFGGLMLIIDPSGTLLHMPVSLLARSPFANFRIPGIILLLVLGVLPVLIGMALLRRWSCALTEKLNLYLDRYWAWTFSLYTGYALLIWIMVQVYWIQNVSTIHLFYFAWALAIQIVTLLPEVQRRYEK